MIGENPVKHKQICKNFRPSLVITGKPMKGEKIGIFILFNEAVPVRDPQPLFQGLPFLRRPFLLRGSHL